MVEFEENNLYPFFIDQRRLNLNRPKMVPKKFDPVKIVKFEENKYCPFLIDERRLNLV